MDRTSGTVEAATNSLESRRGVYLALQGVSTGKRILFSGARAQRPRTTRGAGGLRSVQPSPGSEQQIFDLLVCAHDAGRVLKFFGGMGVRDGDDLHAGRQGRGDARLRVFDGPAVLWGNL